MDNPVKHIDDARLLFEATGQLTELQVLNLKNAPLYVFGPDLSNTVVIDFAKKKIDFELEGTSDYDKNEEKDLCENFLIFVERLLGRSIKVSLQINSNTIIENSQHYERSDRKDRKTKPDDKRKRSVRKVRK